VPNNHQKIIRGINAALITLLLAPLLTAQVVTESFKNATASGWVFSGTGYTANLTSGGVDTSGDGWLRLTSTGGNQIGSAYYNTAFTATNATVYASFDFASWGGTGADGISFFLFDGSSSFALGANGGSLGYAQKTGVNGMAGGYLGVAVDEYGNFSSGTEGRVGGPGLTIDSFSVRGPGSGTTGYDYLGGTATLASSIDTPSVGTRPTGINTVQVLISPTNQLTVALQQGGSLSQTVLSLDLSGYARPDTLKFGFAASTGGSTNYHEIRNLTVTTLIANLWDAGAGDGLWESGSNWNPNILPASGADILFDNTFVSTAQTINTGSNRTVRSIQMDAPFAYTLNNNTITFDAAAVPGFSGIALTQTRGSANHVINSNLALNNDIGVRQNSSGNLSLTGTIGLGSHNLAFDGSGTTTASGVISGGTGTTGTVTKSESGTVNLNATNTYGGGTTVSAGTLATNNNAGFGTGNITLAGGTIASTSANSIANSIALTGNSGITGLTTSGTITQTGGNYTLALSGATLGNVALSDNDTGRTLTTNVAAGTSTIGGVISNGGTSAGSLTKDGFGTLTLSGANTYTGTTTINAGTLTLGASDRLSNSSNVNIAGGTLSLGTYSERVNNLTFSNSGTLDFGTTGNANYFLFANTTGTPSGVLTISNWESGTDVLASSTALTSTILDQLYFVGYGSGATQSAATTVGSYGSGWRPIDPNQTGWATWDSGSTTTNRWSTKQNWVGDVTPTFNSSAKLAFGTGTRTTPDMNGSRTVNAIRFDAGSPSFDLQGASYTLTMSGPNAGSVAFIQQNAANNQTMSMTTMQLSNNTVVDMIGTGNLTVSSALTGAANLVKENTGGTLILSGNSTAYTGGIFVNAGTLQANSANALGATSGTTTVLDGGTLAFSGTFTSAENLTVTGSGVGGAGAIQAVSGTSTLSGAVTLSGATTLAASSGNTLTLSNTATGITGAQALSLAGAGDINVARISTGVGTVDINSTGTVTYDGTGTANTYTGTTTVNSGTLVLNKTAGTNAIAGNLVIGNGSGTDTVRLAASNQIADTAGVTINSSGVFNLNNFDENIARLNGAAGASITLGTGDLSITGSGDSNYAGTITGGATSALNKSGTGKLSLSGSNSSFSGPVGLSAGILNVAGTNTNILGTGTVSVTGTGNIEMQGGATLANAMTLNTYGTGAMDGAIQNIAGNNTVAGNITLAGNSRIQSDAGQLTLAGTVGLSTNSLNVGGTGATAISGSISGTGGLTKDGGGTLFLSAANTFTGATTISAGSIIAEANNVINNAALLTIGTGATLDLNSFAASAGALTGGGVLDFGTNGQLSLSSGTGTFSGTFLGTGTLILNAGSTLTLGANFNAPNLSIILAGGTLDLGGYTSTFGNLNITATSVVNFTGTSSLTVADIATNLGMNLNTQNWTDAVDYLYTQAWTGATADSRGSVPVNQVVFNGFDGSNTIWQAYDRQVTPVPEPATYGAILVGGALALLGYRRRRQG
jgi:fibronectin-binding autotransporter adhesin